MRIILGSFALAALIMLFVCGSKNETQTVTTLSGNSSQPAAVQTSDEVTTQDNVGGEDEYGRPRNKNRRHLFPRLHRQK